MKNITKLHKLYLMFSRSNTMLSKAIYKKTKEPYTHVAISTDESFNEFYSFGRRYTNFMIPAGFAKESPFDGLYKKNQDINIKIMSIDISKEQLDEINNTVNMMYKNRFKYKYDILGLLFCNGNITLNRQNHKFCSQFVSEILKKNNIIDFSKGVKHIRPSEIALRDEFDTVFEGSVYELNYLFGNSNKWNYSFEDSLDLVYSYE